MSMLNLIYGKVTNFLGNFFKIDINYFFKGGFWLSSGQLINFVIGFALSIVYANFLSKETFGTFQYILSIVGMLSIVSLADMNTAVSQAVARGCDGSMVAGFKKRLHWSVFVALISLFIAFYYYANGDKALFYCFLIVACLTPFLQVYTIYQAFLKGKAEFKLLTKYSIISQIIYAVFIIITILWLGDIYSIITVYFLSQTIIHYIFLKLILKRIKPNAPVDAKTIPFGMNLCVLSILGTIALYFDKIIVFQFLGPVELAVYIYAINIPDKLLVFFEPISTLSLPKLSQQDDRIIKKNMSVQMLKIFIITVPATLIYIICAPFLYHWFFPQYQSSIIYSQIYALVIILEGKRLLTTYFNAKMKKKELYIINTVLPLLKIVLMLVLIPVYGIIGIIISLVLYNLITYILLFVLFRFEVFPRKN